MAFQSDGFQADAFQTSIEVTGTGDVVIAGPTITGTGHPSSSQVHLAVVPPGRFKLPEPVTGSGGITIRGPRLRGRGSIDNTRAEDDEILALLLV